MSYIYSYITSFFKSAGPVTPEILSGLKSNIDSAKVVVYSKTYCPYCKSTKSLLESIGQEYKVVELDTISDGLTLQNGLLELTGQKTVPNVFISGKHIGGNSDIQALNASGKLKELLA
ncbi:putative thioltransferase [Scheffersomyces amazonensis]|uniref:putative thioltransferase n=1 Tax=Scheffersomyces amazonensis TaxID=1078765 RepID=UPI00315CF079